MHKIKVRKAARTTAALGALLALSGGALAQDLGAAFRDRARDVSGEPWVRLSVEVPEDALYVGLPFRLGLSFGFDERFVEERMIQLFRQPLDLPAQLEAPWLEGLAGATRLEAGEAPPEDGPTFALGETIVRGTPATGVFDPTRSFLSIELGADFVADAPGDLVVAAPLLRFAYAERFEEDFLGERRPVDRTDAFARGPESTLRVLPLPEAGRPHEFAGSAGPIGRFDVRASLSGGQRARVGEALTLVLTLVPRGPSNLSRIEAPRLPRLAGFDERGVRDQNVAQGRAFHYELVPKRSGAQDLPAFSVWTFDPTPPGRYVALETSVLPLLVAAAPRDEASLDAPTHGSRPAPSPPSLLRRALVLLGCAAAVVVALAWLAARASKKS